MRRYDLTPKDEKKRWERSRDSTIKDVALSGAMMVLFAQILGVWLVDTFGSKIYLAGVLEGLAMFGMWAVLFMFSRTRIEKIGTALLAGLGLLIVLWSLPH